VRHAANRDWQHPVDAQPPVRRRADRRSLLVSIRKPVALTLTSRAVLIVSCLASLPLGAPGAPARPHVRLVETGSFHGEEVSARTGQRWLGLYVSKGGSLLRLTPVRVKPVEDPVDEEAHGAKSGKEVSVRRRPEPVFLLHGATMLRPGPVETVRGHSLELTRTSDYRLLLAGVSYRLKVVAHRHRVRLILSQGRQQQILYSVSQAEFEDSTGWSLDWAGDLDHDHRLDLYLTVSDNYNGSEKKLFLSSTARRGRLVRELANFPTVGC
jgi:hypothetical protein